MKVKIVVNQGNSYISLQDKCVNLYLEIYPNTNMHIVCKYQQKCFAPDPHKGHCPLDPSKGALPPGPPNENL